MKLITNELINRFAQVGCQDREIDPICVARFFNAFGKGTWYATEYDPVTETCFGYVQLFENEWGYFSIQELGEAKHPQLGIPVIERDRYYTESRISQLCPELQESIKRRSELREMEMGGERPDDFELER